MYVCIHTHIRPSIPSSLHPFIDSSFHTHTRNSSHARTHGNAPPHRPNRYFAANSGARIGLAKEVKDCFKVAWNNPADPAKGFRYLYLTPDDYERLSAMGSVIAERVVVQTATDSDAGAGAAGAAAGAAGDAAAATATAGGGGGGAATAAGASSDAAAASSAGAGTTTSGSSGSGSGEAPAGREIHYRLDTIIGADLDLGVENLQGSGAIAGESARAYDDIFTLTYVCGRSVGIGAYVFVSFSFRFVS